MVESLEEDKEQRYEKKTLFLDIYKIETSQ